MYKFMVLFILLVFMGCASYEEENYERFNVMFFDVFDTFTSVIGYAETIEEFEYFSNVIHEQLHHFHILFDMFNEYQGINNIYTINRNAGIASVKVHEDIIEVLTIGKKAYHQTNGVVNIAIGAVTKIWREYISSSANTLPDMEALIYASKLTNINDIVINAEESTVFLRYEGMSLDIGSIGKGFAIEKTANFVMEKGFESFTLSVGGDMFLAQAPRSVDRDAWGVGVTDPNNRGEIIDVIFTKNTAVFTSGDYRRYFVVDGVRMHHIIDPSTLMPASVAASVTVMHPSSIVAENLSLAAFIMDIEEGKRLMQDFGAQAIWVLADGTVIKS
ncbi:MAG: FAD:protein FMN transferase [Defluviitaleaceae bacterium]|nr:FAD:protein FMN transferase [Defluviitaleaceae bacterium]